MKKTGILLINLGTPSAPTTKAVRAFLKEFLSDPRVLDIPTIPRQLLLQLIILPFRSKQSAKLYQKIWDKEKGSPLLYHSENLKNDLQEKLMDMPVALGMRYGNPSIKQALNELSQQHCDRIVVLPLFPQYASATNGSVIEKVFAELKNQNNIPELVMLGDFYDQDFFIDTQASLLKKTIANKNIEHVLFSYHGLPERQIEKAGCHKTFCRRKAECPAIQDRNRYCYRAQCFATTREILLHCEELRCAAISHTTCFQSRLGRIPWIEPYTDHVLNDLAKQGIKNIAVCCPSFTGDCLETLEEIHIRAKEQWQSLGGETFIVSPCVNSHASFVAALAGYLTNQKV